MTKIERSYHDNGTLASEVTLLDGTPHGLTRLWYPNGVLSDEIPLTKGIIDGLVRKWNEKGELIGQCIIKNGNGIYRTWFANGQLMGEVTMVDGKLSGQDLAFSEDGELISVSYWLDNKQVSRKRYMEACRENPNLPHYENESKLSPPRSQKIKKPRRRKPKKSQEASKKLGELAQTLLDGPHVREALAWLEESQQPSRSLGEATDRQGSLHLVKKLYAIGAVTVYAVEIDDEDEDQNSGKLVIELPPDSEQRKKIFWFCSTLAHERGFDSDIDVGQRYVLLMLD